MIQLERQWLFCGRLRPHDYGYRKKGPGYRATERPFYIMSDEHKMTKQDKLVLTITLAAIFFGVFALGLIGLIFNLSS